MLGGDVVAGRLSSAGRNRLPAAQPSQRQPPADVVKRLFAEAAWEGYLYWSKQDKRMVEHINKLIREIQYEPFSGVGKPY